MDTYFYDAEMETGEMPLLPKLGWGVKVNPCIPASQVQIGYFVRHSKTAGGTGVYEVTGISTVYDGHLLFKCKGFSELGAEIHPSLLYRPEEEIEVVGYRLTVLGEV